jgi:signal transduction histidine kinase
VSRVRERHNAVRNRLNQEAVRRDVNLRVNRSLEALEGFIRETRGVSLDEAKLLAAINDPTIPGTARDRERKLSVSELIVSVQRQLVQQSEFINVAAHELRTPITPILTYVEILESGMQGNSEELEAIKRNAIRLQRLAENILHVARIDSKTLNLSKEVFDLNAFLEDIVRERTLTKPKPSPKFIIPTERTLVFADRDRVSQVISNLLDNALRYARNDSAIVSVRKTDLEAIVQVTDNGPGIDASVLPILFTKFGARAQGGTGLGLFICKGIIEAHGGRMSARNKEKTEAPGAIFEFTLPLSSGLDR